MGKASMFETSTPRTASGTMKGSINAPFKRPELHANRRGET
jgi:hypothetical protein